ncbi:hypothetical protein PC116_g6486 [Phytophthora cactorum]|uniref:Uncharacterized protein n=1 Tax=Phytophthora cactorum TaxID=29920 RepID=A0A8T1DVR0_9STRA|nr:hypothetical protein Pcac1_g8617 [Phytophthora cactorum]KAG2945752.1 hypothetical protein PC117_g8235 [Phytophthora cactorum]KAG3024899.1 hypothetical protein PC120_g6825 [Phytophthora cactorum]KAG3026964.1 hypothetical protein PC119_g7559 [Phytophthora cactorum]KAG3177085.1 hypothetical protein C6341_g8624 [Phytophthora cactorum]
MLLLELGGIKCACVITSTSRASQGPSGSVSS